MYERGTDGALYEIGAGVGGMWIEACDFKKGAGKGHISPNAEW